MEPCMTVCGRKALKLLLHKEGIAFQQRMWSNLGHLTSRGSSSNGVTALDLRFGNHPSSSKYNCPGLAHRTAKWVTVGQQRTYYGYT